jgi:AcrR family transcriptional regulator
MARSRSDDFVPRLLQAATRVFARKGLKRTRMTDIAREMGVAHGSPYNYVESKEALFLLLIERWANLDQAAGTQVPIKTPSMARIVERLQRRIESVFPLPTLDRGNLLSATFRCEGGTRICRAGAVSTDRGVSRGSRYPRKVGARHARTMSALFRTGPTRTVRAHDPLRDCSSARRQFQASRPGCGRSVHRGDSHVLRPSPTS